MSSGRRYLPLRLSILFPRYQSKGRFLLYEVPSRGDSCRTSTPRVYKCFYLSIPILVVPRFPRVKGTFYERGP